MPFLVERGLLFFNGRDNLIIFQKGFFSFMLDVCKRGLSEYNIYKGWSASLYIIIEGREQLTILVESFRQVFTLDCYRPE